MKKVDQAIQNLDTLQHRTVIRELTRLVVLYIRARASKKIHRAICEGQARMALCALSNGTRNILETALRNE